MSADILLIVFVSFFLLDALGRMGLAHLNIGHLRRHGREVPTVFQGEIDEATLSRMSDYTATSQKFDSREHLFNGAVTLGILLSGLLPWLNGIIESLGLPFVPSGLIFFGTLALADAILGMPFAFHRTFAIEKGFGFNTMTVRLWIEDNLKELALSAIILGALLGVLLALMAWSPRCWWFFIWVIFASFQFLLLWLYPVVIAPLFNKFEPLKDEALRTALIDLMQAAGLKTEGIYQVDAGKRSRHTNAYFTGMGKSKRIVLYDTLLSSCTAEEIVAVLAHEIGHWKRHHIRKQLLSMEIVSLVLFYAVSRLVEWPLLHEAFGFSSVVPYVGLLLAAALFGPASFLFTPLSAALQRKYEREADAFAVALVKGATPLCDALKRLAKDNLANLHPHPLYAAFYYSHPALTDRIARLQSMDARSSS